MNSDERRAARRARRDAKRAANRAKRLEGCTLESVANIDNLYLAARRASRKVGWKSSVQRYMLRVIPNIIHARRDLLDGRDISRGFIEFELLERGKARHIMSVHFSERVIHKSLNENALIPAIWPTLTPGCGANVKGRGTDYSLMRLKSQLARHYRLHGTEGYILQFDFSNYFGNLDHDVCKRFIDRMVDDKGIRDLMRSQIDAHGAIGLGLGAEPNQTIAVALPTPIDRLMLRADGIEQSGRSMDDGYAISVSKDDLRSLLKGIERECKRLGIVLNPRKTRIVKLSHGFTYLKKHFKLTETGKIIVTPCRESVTRERRKVKKHKRLVEIGVMTFEQAERSYMSWRGSLVKRHGDGKPRFRMNAHRTVREMDALFASLFPGWQPPR